MAMTGFFFSTVLKKEITMKNNVLAQQYNNTVAKKCQKKTRDTR